MSLDPISIATAGYVCGTGPNAISIATNGYVCTEIVIVDPGPSPADQGGRGDVTPMGDDLTIARRKREEREVIEIAIALISSGVLDELS